MAEDKNKFQSIYGDSENEFDIEDVSDETTSIPKEAIAEATEQVSEGAAEEHEEHIVEESAEEESSEETAEEQEGEPSEEPAEEQEEEPSEEPAQEQEELASEEAADAEAATDTAESSDDDDIADETLPDDITFDEHRTPAEDADEAEIAQADRQQEEPAEDDGKVGILSYILHAILFTIPVIGTIVMLVYIISDRKNEHLRHFAQIWLVTLLIIAIGAYAAITILGIA